MTEAGSAQLLEAALSSRRISEETTGLVGLELLAATDEGRSFLAIPAALLGFPVRING